MSEEDIKKEESMTNVTHIDDARIKRLAQKGHLMSMIEEYEILRLKLLYDQPMTKTDVHRLVVLCKYFMQYGPSEPFRLSCKLMYEKYMQPFGL